MAQLRECSAQSKEEINSRKILSVMEMEFGEIKKGMEWKVERKMLIVSGLGIIPDCSEKALWEELRKPIQSIAVKRGVKEIGDFSFYILSNLIAVDYIQT